VSLKIEDIVVWRVLVVVVVVRDGYGWELLDVGTSDDIAHMTQGKYISVTTRNGNTTCSVGD
jgi:hypothetical protein